MKRTAFIVAFSMTVVAGCESTPTSPPPTPELSISQSSVALSRTATTQVTAMSTVSGVSTDVTASTTWRSDNVQVATVSAGLILAVGPGTTNITADHGGQTKAVAVTVRRRTYLTGEVRVEDLDGEATIESVFINVDGDQVGGRGGSGRTNVFTARMAISPENAVVEPGNRTLKVRVFGGPSDVRPEYRATWAISIRIRDLDTGDTLSTLSIAPKTVQATSTPDPQEIDWAIAIPVFTS